MLAFESFGGPYVKLWLKNQFSLISNEKNRVVAPPCMPFDMPRKQPRCFVTEPIHCVSKISLYQNFKAHFFLWSPTDEMFLKTSKIEKS
jgi:hypothetical protein